MRILKCLCFILLFTPNVYSEIVAGPDDLYVRVVDVGAGLCCIVQMPGERYMIYDAGLHDNAMDDIREIISDVNDIDLLVLSHSDADHIGAVDEICDEYTIKKVLRSGNQRTTAAWNNANNAIYLENKKEKCMDINLTKWEFPPGSTYKFGDVFVTMVSGFGTPPKDWNLKNKSEKNNAGSIVIRIQYQGKSILFCGDAVGRHLNSANDNECIASEKYMIEMSEVIPIKSDIIIAPHHGSDGASSNPFIKAVDPTYVIFSAGHKNQHPTKLAAKRYIDHNVDVNNIFRTDLEDDERKDNKPDKEWSYGRKDKVKDKKGDDSIDIVIRSNGDIEVDYH